jgi:iron uptake system EfeUOB component EfeO/EfeM
MEISTEYQYTEAIAEFYGELDDFIIVRIDDGKIQLRKVVKEK